MGAAAMTGAPPTFANTLHPTVQELRRGSIFYRASAGQGYGRLFGPMTGGKTSFVRFNSHFMSSLNATRALPPEYDRRRHRQLERR